MAEIHKRIFEHGRDKARQLALAEGADATTLKSIDLAARMLAEETESIGISYSGFCLTALPHKRLPDDQVWEREGRNVRLHIEPGRLFHQGSDKLVGVPYGSRARLILLYLQTEAIRNNSREVELGRSMRQWLERMDVPVGGKSYKDVQEQASRISACRLHFTWTSDDGRRKAWDEDKFVKSGFALAADDGLQGTLWEERVVLGETFFAELKKHPVPVSETAIRLISNQSLTIDVYVWLAYRLHTLLKPTPITWAALMGQFGAGYGQLKHFKPRFLDALRQAEAVYPEARMEVTEKGIMLHPSRPPIAKRGPVLVSG